MLESKGDRRELRGRIAELKCMATCAARDWEVSIPFHLINAKYDISIRRNTDEGWIKVQIKRAWWNASENSFSADLRKSSKKKYTAEEIDVFMIWAPETDSWWFIPFEDVEGQCRINLSSKKFNNYILPGETLT